MTSNGLETLTTGECEELLAHHFFGRAHIGLEDLEDGLVRHARVV